VTVVLTAVIINTGVSDTKTFSLIVKAQDMTAQQKLDADKAALAMTFSAGDSATAVTRSITLPNAGVNGSLVTWVSSTPAIISHDGKTVNRPAVGAGDATVIFTAFITNGGLHDTKLFTLTVKQQLTAQQKVESDKASLAIGYAVGDNENSVTRPLNLPVTGVNGTTITWVSTQPAVISNDGKTVTRPAIGAGDTTVVLNAIITTDGMADTKSFTVRVKQQLTDAEKVVQDKALLAIGFKEGDTATSVTGAITLPATGVNGSVITWISSTPSVISNDGKTVIRPAAGSGDVTVVLTAVIVSGGSADTKAFPVVVKQR